MASQYETSRNNPRNFKALTSLSLEAFDALLPVFEGELEDFFYRFTLQGTPRARKYSPKNPGQLPTPADKLFFVLYFKKNNPLQEAMAAFFGLDVSMCNKWIHILMPVLEKSLKKKAPSRSEKDVSLEEGVEYMIDGTERPVNRPTYDQEGCYSGKKKAHTVKNLLITAPGGKIVWLGPTEAGKAHDKKMADKITFSNKARMLADLGFMGWKPENLELSLPIKKPKNTKTETRELTEEQKSFNKGHAARRVAVEHSIGSAKIMRIAKDKNRNWKEGFRDLIMVLACSLHNFRLDFV